MSEQAKARLIMVVGLIVLVVSLGANSLGIGPNPDTFGNYQWFGTIAGLLLAGYGFYLSRK